MLNLVEMLMLPTNVNVAALPEKDVTVMFSSRYLVSLLQHPNDIKENYDSIGSG